MQWSFEHPSGVTGQKRTLGLCILKRSGGPHLRLQWSLGSMAACLEAICLQVSSVSWWLHSLPLGSLSKQIHGASLVWTQERSLRRELFGNSNKPLSAASFLPDHLWGGEGMNHILCCYFFFLSSVNYLDSVPCLLCDHSRVRFKSWHGIGPMKSFLFGSQTILEDHHHFCMFFCCLWMCLVLWPF